MSVLFDRKFGLIGYPLSHTFSPKYFTKKFHESGIKNCEYQAYPIEEISQVRDLFSTLKGINVTIPYKEQVIPYLDDVSTASRAIKAVNTIKVVDGKTVGYNTDVIGFESTLVEFLGTQKVKKALVLGSGGAAKAVIYVLRKLGIRYTTISRNSRYLTYHQLTDDLIESHKLIVNTTPLGMYPHEDSCPDINYEALGKQHFLYDLIYNPEKTIFLKKGEQAGANIKNGYDMLIAQAEASWNIWNTP